MKNKHGRGIQAPRLGNIVIDGKAEYPAGDKHSWLTDALGLDKGTRVRQARSIASEVFLQTRLFPLVENRVLLDEPMLVDLLVDFKRSRVDLDVDFEIAQVMARILSRFQFYLIDEADSPSRFLSDSLAQELDLFAALADIDFQRIDEAVRNRLHSG